MHRWQSSSSGGHSHKGTFGPFVLQKHPVRLNQPEPAGWGPQTGLQIVARCGLPLPTAAGIAANPAPKRCSKDLGGDLGWRSVGLQ